MPGGRARRTHVSGRVPSGHKRPSGRRGLPEEGPRPVTVRFCSCKEGCSHSHKLGILLGFSIRGPLLQGGSRVKAFKHPQVCKPSSHGLYGPQLRHDMARPEPLPSRRLWGRAGRKKGQRLSSPAEARPWMRLAAPLGWWCENVIHMGPTGNRDGVCSAQHALPGTPLCQAPKSVLEGGGE